MILVCIRNRCWEAILVWRLVSLEFLWKGGKKMLVVLVWKSCNCSGIDLINCLFDVVKILLTIDLEKIVEKFLFFSWSVEVISLLRNLSCFNYVRWLTYISLRSVINLRASWIRILIEVLLLIILWLILYRCILIVSHFWIISWT